MRYLVRQLSASPLASVDPEDFFDFTQVRPIVRLTAEGQRIVRWPRVRSGPGSRPRRRLACFGAWSPSGERAYASRSRRRRARGGSGSCPWARSSRPCPTLGPHSSRVTAPTPHGMRD